MSMVCWKELQKVLARPAGKGNYLKWHRRDIATDASPFYTSEWKEFIYHSVALYRSGVLFQSETLFQSEKYPSMKI